MSYDANGGSSTPAIAIAEVGRGRSMSISSDSMWRWRFGGGGGGGAAAERAFHRFWSNSLRWLVRDPEHSRVQVLLGKHRYLVDEPITVAVKALDENYQRRAGASVYVRVRGSAGDTVLLDELHTDETGHASISLKARPEEPYIVEANLEGWHDATSASGLVGGYADSKIPAAGTGRGVFVVEANSIELSYAAPRPKLLKAIAEHTGGRFFELSDSADIWQDFVKREAEAVEIDRRKNVESWDNGIALIVAFGVLGADWALRRRRGYL